MQSVGQKLRAARLAQGCTLEQVHASTRISLHTLEAMEADDAASVSSAFLYRSFVRQYAAYLTLDYNELSASVDANTNQIPEPAMPGEQVRRSDAIRVPALQIGRRRRVRWLKPITSFAIAMVACTGLYSLWQNDRLHVPRFLSKTQSTAPVQPAIPAAPADNNSQPASNGQDRSAGTNPAGFTLELSATEPAWLSIVADGKVSFRGILERAETKILEGHQTARIRTGNAGAVEAVFNGRPIGTLGSRGQVRTVVFTRNDYEVLDSSPQISALRFNQNAVFVRPFPSLREASAAF